MYNAEKHDVSLCYSFFFGWSWSGSMSRGSVLPAVTLALMVEYVLVDGYVDRVRFRDGHREVLLHRHRVRSLDHVWYLRNNNVSMSRVCPNLTNK